MKKYQFFLFFMILLGASFSMAAETIIMIRHAEKPKSNLGQLSCKGLNRSLLLPAYFKGHFPKPDYIFAPNPGVKNAGFNYVRPLATIEPTAIQLVMPVNTEIGYNQDERFVRAISRKKYHHSVVYVAWEHHHLMSIAKRLLLQFHSKKSAPFWADDDYSMVYVFKISWRHPYAIHLSVQRQNFKNISSTCPIK